MDEIDEKIIYLLRRNSRTPFVEIADKIGLTEGAVRARVGKLVADGVIKKFTIDAEEGIKAIVTIATSSNVPTTRVANSVKELGIEKTYEVSGDYDIICFIQSGQMSEIDKLVEKIRKVNGVVDTKTFMVLK